MQCTLNDEQNLLFYLLVKVVFVESRSFPYKYFQSRKILPVIFRMLFTHLDDEEYFFLLIKDSCHLSHYRNCHLIMSNRVRRQNTCISLRFHTINYCFQRHFIQQIVIFNTFKYGGKLVKLIEMRISVFTDNHYILSTKQHQLTNYHIPQ